MSPRRDLGERPVVFVCNFVAPDKLAILQHWAEISPRPLIVLTSVAMEGNRRWQPDAGGLDVRVQRSWTLRRRDVHPSGYRDVNFVHLPLRTVGELRRLRPAAVVTTELGLRTALTQTASRRNVFSAEKTFPVVNAISTTALLERSRASKWRTAWRRWLIGRSDLLTYHGPQCRDWLSMMGADNDSLRSWDYAADPRKIHDGPVLGFDEDSPLAVRVITVGQMIDRKGVGPAMDAMIAAATGLPQVQIRWRMLGDGPRLSELRQRPRPVNLSVEFAGHVDSQTIRGGYRDCELLFFPTLADEWGLVVDEAMHSGLAVIGTDGAQSFTTLVRTADSAVGGITGYRFDPQRPISLTEAIADFVSRTRPERLAIRTAARQSVAHRTARASAVQINSVVEEAILSRQHDQKIFPPPSLKWMSRRR